MGSVIRRSGARDLPPSADAEQSGVLDLSGVPTPGKIVRMLAPCGLELDIRITEAERIAGGWRGWGLQVKNSDDELRALGVPACGINIPVRVFDWQVLNK